MGERLTKPRPTWALHDIDDVPSLVRKRLHTLSTFTALDRDEQEDVVQAMLEAVITLEKQWRGDSTFSHFIWKTLPNKLTDYFRKYHKDLRYESHRNISIVYTDDNAVFEGVHWDDEDDTPDEHELLEAVDVDGLSEAARDTLFHYAIPLRRGQDIEDLAALHNVTQQWIRKRLHALAKETACL